VNKATLTVKADDKSRVFGAPNPTLTATFTGFVNSEVLATSGVAGAPSLTTTAIQTSPVVAGGYPITAAIGTLAAANYQFTFANGTLTVNQAATIVSLTNQTLSEGVTSNQSHSERLGCQPVDRYRKRGYGDVHDQTRRNRRRNDPGDRRQRRR
jgi:hypothetical protein